MLVSMWNYDVTNFKWCAITFNIKIKTQNMKFGLITLIVNNYELVIFVSLFNDRRHILTVNWDYGETWA